MALVTADQESQARSPTGLRFGVLLDSLVQPAWVERALRRVMEVGAAKPALIVRNLAPATGVGSSVDPVARPGYGSSRLYAWYEQADRRRFSSPDDPLNPVDVSRLLAGVPVLEVRPEQSMAIVRFDEADVDRIRAAQLDVLFEFGFGTLRGAVLHAARYGIWSYHHGDDAAYRGGPPCLWEVIEDAPVTGIVLRQVTEDGGRVLYRSYSATNRFSVTKNRSELYWKGAEFLERVARRLRDTGVLFEDEEPRQATPGLRLRTAPTNVEMAVGMARLATRRLTAAVEARLFEDQWFLAYRRSEPSPGVLALPPHGFRPILPPRDRYWADPFPVQVGGADFILFEDYQYSTQKGRISALRIGHEGPVGEAITVLDRDYHLSYPLVFEWRGAHFMMPETADAGRVEVYRATRFPFEWTLETVAMEGTPMADCTVAELGGRWWMFATTASAGASFWDELHLHHGPSPLGPWMPHRGNPVVSDVRSARPAGNLFSSGGRWLRPSQDSSRRYGWALNIQEIVRIDESAYEERTITKVLPDWRPGLTGVHTMNVSGGFTVIDACQRMSRFSWRQGEGASPAASGAP